MVMGYLFAALVVLHIAAALRHHFALKDGVLRRMV
jgi:cytochrome b561